ncbi:MAG: hypothetical protein AMS27_15090 [Bacteroides sp. SM23_62_1]|nr:MAG: hypothetical protein AMS27_15090 [Bacteroides sp. SM23_62_1]
MKKLLVLFALVAFLGVISSPVFAVTETGKITRVLSDDDPKKKENKEDKETKDNKETKEVKDQKSECPDSKTPACCEKSKECTDKK